VCVIDILHAQERNKNKITFLVCENKKASGQFVAVLYDFKLMYYHYSNSHTMLLFLMPCGQHMHFFNSNYNKPVSVGNTYGERGSIPEPL
jgi:hypothetical protein